MNSTQIHNPWEPNPDEYPVPHENDPPDRPPQQNPEAPDTDPNLPQPAFPLPAELDPATPTRQD